MPARVTCKRATSGRSKVHPLLLTALLALSSAALAATPVSKPSAPPATSDGATSSPEVSSGVLPLLPAQPPATEVSGGVLPLLPEPQAPAIARGVGVEALPLLVTEPPKGDTSVAIPAPVTGGQDSVLNPFSPLLLPQPAPPAAPPSQAPSAPPAPTQLPAAAAPPTPPAPTPVSAATPAPAAPVAPVPLPQVRTTRPGLPAGLAAKLRTAAPLTADLSANPLGRALNTPGNATNALGPASALAAVRAPPSLTPLGTAPAPGAAAAQIPSGAQQVALGSGLSTLGFGGGDGNFTSLGGNRVSRALSSLQVHFTAMATGTAIFRVGDGTAAILLAPGETLPGTKLVLTGLTNRGAEFTEDDVRHTLFLTP